MNKDTAIRRLLLKSFTHIYCDTCDNVGQEDICEQCSRKEMKWELSTKEAELLTIKIIKIMEK